MNLQERITYYYQEKKYNCSETIIHAANDVYALNLDKDSMKMLAGFGSGMYSGKTCGALIGCVRHFTENLDDTECKNIRPHSYDPDLHCLCTVQKAGKALESTIAELKKNER